MAVNVGVIGCGKWGKNHVRIYSEIDCNLVGLADINPKAKNFANEYGISFETDYRKLLPSVDAVSIVVPTNLHYEVVKECLLAGKHVLVEKPITLDSKQAIELGKLAKKKGLILNVGYIFRFNAAVLQLKDEIKNLGDIQHITARYVHSNKPPRRDCGVIFNFAIHLIDILNFTLQIKPNKVFCKKLNYLSKEREDSAFLILDYGDFMANLEVSWFHPLKKRDMWIIGSEEKIYTDFFEQMMVKYPIKIGYDKIVSETPINVEIHKNEPLKDELRHFCNSVENNKFSHRTNSKSKTLNVGEEAYITTKICEAALESAELGKEIKL